MGDLWNRIKTEPALLNQLIQAVLGLLVATGAITLSDTQTGAILGAVTAGMGLVLAVAVRPFKWTAITTVVQAAVILVTSFGLELSSATVAGIYAVTAALGAILVRQTSTPETKLPAVSLQTPR